MGFYALEIRTAKQVAQLATYDILDAREFEPIVLPVGPRWQGVKPGDCITITEPEFGMVGQPVIARTPATGPDQRPGEHHLMSQPGRPGTDPALSLFAQPAADPGLQPQDFNFFR